MRKRRIILLPLIDYSAILEVYSLSELLELNDRTEEEALEFMLRNEFIELPEVRPIDLD